MTKGVRNASKDDDAFEHLIRNSGCLAPAASLLLRLDDDLTPLVNGYIIYLLQGRRARAFWSVVNFAAVQLPDNSRVIQLVANGESFSLATR